METPDGYWRVEIIHEYGRRQRWYRIIHGSTVVAQYAVIATVQRILGDALETLELVATGDGADGVA